MPRAQAPVRRRTRVSSRSQSSSSEPPPAALTVGAASDPASDPALELFLRRPPSAADHFVIVLQNFDGSDGIVADVSRGEVLEQNSVDLANTLTLSTRALATNERRECRFRATWQSGDRVLGSYAWRTGEGEGSQHALDGSLQSMLAQNQRHLESLMRSRGEDEGRYQRSFDRILGLYEKRILALEQRVAEQAELLRNNGSFEQELASQELAASIEGRTRTQEILLSRFMPLAEAAVQRYLTALPAQTTEPPAAANSGTSSNGKAS